METTLFTLGIVIVLGVVAYILFQLKVLNSGVKNPYNYDSIEEEEDFDLFLITQVANIIDIPTSELVISELPLTDFDYYFETSDILYGVNTDSEEEVVTVIEIGKIIFNKQYDYEG